MKPNPDEFMRTIPGIGLINAMFILTEVEDIDRFPNADKFALRSAFIESAWVTLRMDPAMLLLYQNLVKL